MRSVWNKQGFRDRHAAYMNNVNRRRYRLGDDRTTAAANLTTPTLDVYTAAVGDTLTCTPGTWEAPYHTIHFDWQYDDGSGWKSISGAADQATYTLTSAEMVTSIRCQVAASRFGQLSTWVSTPEAYCATDPDDVSAVLVYIASWEDVPAAIYRSYEDGGIKPAFIADFSNNVHAGPA